MKIENSGVQPGSLSATAPIQSANANAAGAHKQSLANDQVKLSPLARACASDDAKICQLKSAYESGAYRISPDQIAANMISDAMAI